MKDLKRKVKSYGLDDEFSVSFETTHHGPWLTSPSLFIEIGSTEEKWGHEVAASVLADVIISGLNLDGDSGIPIINPKKIVFCLGGGHYAPQPMRLSDKGITIGHMLASYSLNIEKQESSEISKNEAWKLVILSAYNSTKRSNPDSEVWAYLDRKSFKGWQRKKIRNFLLEQGIKFGRTVDLMDS